MKDKLFEGMVKFIAVHEDELRDFIEINDLKNKNCEELKKIYLSMLERKKNQYD